MFISASIISIALSALAVTASPAVISRSGTDVVSKDNSTVLVSARAIPADALHFPTCSDAEANAVRDALTAATAYAMDAVTYLQAHPVDDDTDNRYQAWFGTKTAEGYNRVLGMFQEINGYYQGTPRYAGAPVQQWYFYCHAENAGAVTPKPVLCDPVERDEFAKVRATVLGVMTLCPQFWAAPATGHDSMAGTLIHEASHYRVGGVSGTNEDMAETYSVDSCLELARDHPDQAINNAENYEYFTELPDECPLGSSKCTVS